MSAPQPGRVIGETISFDGPSLRDVCQLFGADADDYMGFVVLLVPPDPNGPDEPVAIHTDAPGREALATLLQAVTEVVMGT